jgi:DNA-binding MarR family transcriptional regulator
MTDPPIPPTPFLRTSAMRDALRVLAALDGAETFPREVALRANMPPVSVGKILDRLEGIGWLTSRWGRRTGRDARRHYYRVTAEGRRGIEGLTGWLATSPTAGGELNRS